MRLMKRDLSFVAERWLYFWMFVAYLRRAERSELGKVLVETTILSMVTRRNLSQGLHDPGADYKAATDGIALLSC
jgi:hypothetical protein